MSTHDYSIDFTLIAIFLAAVIVYTNKKGIITTLDIVYGFLLSGLLYIMLISIDSYQNNKKGFKLIKERFSSMNPSEHDDEDFDDQEDEDRITHLPTTTTHVEEDHLALPSSHPASHHNQQPIEKAYLALPAPSDNHTVERARLAPDHLITHHDDGSSTLRVSGGTDHIDDKKKHNDHKSNQAHKMNNDKRPSTNRHHMSDGKAVAEIDAPINITIKVDDDVSKPYKQIPVKRHVDRQFDDGLTADRVSRLERRIEQLMTRELDNEYKEVVKRSPEFQPEPIVIYKDREQDCPVCPLVAEKPWSEWADANTVDKHPHGHHHHDKRKRWEGVRGGNNPLPILP